MATKILLLLTSLLATGLCTSKSRYKVVLNQQGYTQFIQYDVPTPSLREITLCIWIKLYHTRGPQSIITYLAKGNNRIIKIWLDEEARYLKLAIKGYAKPKVPINLGPNVWNHFCFSYQSEYGAYALYLNGDLLQCEATEKLIGYALPAGGSIIIGYGITLDGKTTGFSGEIYGVNMVITSTIKINNTMHDNNSLVQNANQIDKTIIANLNTNVKYIILNELKDNETVINNIQSKTTPRVVYEKTIKNHKYLQELFDSQEATDLQLRQYSSKQSNKQLTKIEKNNKPHNKHLIPKHGKNLFKMLTSKENQFGSTDISVTSFPEVPTGLFQHEVPPPISVPPRTTKKPSGFRKQENSLKQQFKNVVEIQPERIFPPTSIPEQQIPSLGEQRIFHFPVTHTEIKTNSLPQHVVPPPLPPDPFTKKSKVLFQQTNLKSNEKKYIKKKSTKVNASKEISEFEVPPPPSMDTKVYGQWTAFTHNGKISEFAKNMRYDYRKVPPTIPLITVSETFPYPPYKIASNLVPNNINRRVFTKREAIRPEINVKILNEHNLKTTILNEHSKIKVRNVDITHRGQSDIKTRDSPNKDLKSGSFDNYDDDSIIKERPSFVELPFIKALEYYEPDLHMKNNYVHNDTHSAQTIKEGVTFNGEESLKSDFNNIINDQPLKQPQEYTKYVYKHKLDEEVTNQMDFNTDKEKHEENFHRHVKIGNALNERFVIGKNPDQKKRSFEGGNELVPEINRYRSDIDKVYDKVPNSLMPKVCRNIDMLDLSTKNVERHKYSIASEFILQSLNHDFQDISKFEYQPLFYINWHVTPVRLFGGATPVKELDICTIIKCVPNVEPIQ